MQEMIIPIITALIAAGASLLGTILVTSNNNKELIHKIETSQAVTDTKIQNLTEEVRKHNNFAERIPVIETNIKNMVDRLNNVEDDLKNKWV